MRSLGSSSPAAARCPPWRVRCSEHASSAAIRSKPGMLRAEPRARVAVDREQDDGLPVACRPAARRRSRRRRGASPPRRAPAPAPRPARAAARPARLLGAVGDLALGRAALGVGAVELGGDRRGAVGILGQHQLDPGVGAVEAPGGVDPRRQPEAEGALVDALGLDLGDRHQRAQPGPGRRAEHAQPLAHQPPVLADQGDHVGDGRQRDQVELRRARRRPGGGPPQRQRELVGDPGGAERAERVAAHDRVQDRAVREALRRLVVVGDDHLDPGGDQRLDLLGRADPAVDRDHQLGAASPSAARPTPR